MMNARVPSSQAMVGDVGILLQYHPNLVEGPQFFVAFIFSEVELQIFH